MGFSLGDIGKGAAALSTGGLSLLADGGGDFLKGGTNASSVQNVDRTTTESGTTQSVRNLPPELQALFTQFLGQAGDFGDLGPEGVFQGSRLGAEDALVASGQDSILSQLPQLQQQTDGAAQTVSDLLQFNADDPVVQQLIESLGTNVGDQFNRVILPGINQGATSSGQFGSSRQGIAQGLAAGEASKALTQGTASILNQQRDRSLQAASLAPSIFQSQLLPGQIEQDIGFSRGARTQAELDDEIQQFESARDAGFRSLSEFQSVLNNNPLLAGIGTTTSSVDGTSRVKGTSTGKEETEGSLIQGLTGLLSAGAGLIPK